MRRPHLGREPARGRRRCGSPSSPAVGRPALTCLAALRRSLRCRTSEGDLRPSSPIASVPAPLGHTAHRRLGARRPDECLRRIVASSSTGSHDRADWSIVALGDSVRAATVSARHPQLSAGGADGDDRPDRDGDERRSPRATPPERAASAELERGGDRAVRKADASRSRSVRTTSPTTRTRAVRRLTATRRSSVRPRRTWLRSSAAFTN
jgi:hypothetical protein